MIRGPSPPPAADTDWKRLETLLQQALTQGRFVSEAPRPVATPTAARAAPVPTVQHEAEEVEELEELDELEEVDELVAEAEELEELNDADEAEEVEDAEEVDELEEAEEVEELEAVEAAEDLERVEEAEADLEEVEELDDSEQDQASSDEALEELEVVDDAAEELLPLDEGVSLFHHRHEALSRVEPVSLDGLESLEEDEVLEELPEDPVPEPRGSQTSYALDELDALWPDTLDEAPVDEVAPASELESALFDDLVPQRPERDWSWKSGGFDWDRFALGDDEVGLFRALSDLVTELDAFMATILTREADHWKGLTSVGFSDAGKGLLDFGPQSPLVRDFLGARALHVIEGAEVHPVLRASFHEKDGKFLRTVVCVPLHFRGQEAWLVLGLRREVGDVLHLLRPRRVT